jgi:hypothetical protein
MERALEGKPVADFREPTQWPVWRSFERGPYALSYDPYYVPPPPAPEPDEEEGGDDGKPAGDETGGAGGAGASDDE